MNFESQIISIRRKQGERVNFHFGKYFSICTFCQTLHFIHKIDDIAGNRERFLTVYIQICIQLSPYFRADLYTLSSLAFPSHSVLVLDPIIFKPSCPCPHSTTGGFNQMSHTFISSFGFGEGKKERKKMETVLKPLFWQLQKTWTLPIVCNVVTWLRVYGIAVQRQSDKILLFVA